LTDMHFAGEVTATDGNILIYKFKDKSSNRGVYVVWAKTSRGYTVNNYALSVKGAKVVQAIAPIVNSTEGQRSDLNIINGTVQIDITEKPLFISVDFIDHS